ncbi:MAG: type II toxin-antitoxin system ParD family antitoxin [Gammaproteobacteria bacterium]|nr:type II toxin-antitoxin system ParD family antitoxin [Gammaproteobacteria bacterium]MYB36001.1 type II toxin-antitoxin system ParD family antitoxin [Gammaproteobacteria bacterium]
MSTMNISLPDSLKEFVDNQVGSLGYSSSGEYMRELIRRDRDRQLLRGLLLEGAASPQSTPADPSYFEGLRNRVHAARHG